MITTPLQNAGIFLSETFFGFAITLVLIRFLFQLVRADFQNPLAQFVVKITSPILKPLRKIIPGIRGIDTASVIAMLLLQILKIFGSYFIKTGHLLPLNPFSLLGLSIWSAAELVSLTLTIYTFSIFIVVIFSWIPQAGYNPFAAILSQLTEPVLRLVRRYIPSIAGLDLSPIAVLIVFQLIGILFTDPIATMGKSLIR